MIQNILDYFEPFIFLSLLILSTPGFFGLIFMLSFEYFPLNL